MIAAFYFTRPKIGVLAGDEAEALTVARQIARSLGFAGTQLKLDEARTEAALKKQIAAVNADREIGRKLRAAAGTAALTAYDEAVGRRRSRSGKTKNKQRRAAMRSALPPMPPNG